MKKQWNAYFKGLGQNYLGQCCGYWCSGASYQASIYNTAITTTVNGYSCGKSIWIFNPNKNDPVV